MSRQQAGQHGFTLVELLLAVTLMSLLMALAYGGFRAAGRASESGQALLEQTGEMRIAQTFIRRQLNQMLPLEFIVDGNGDQLPVLFAGDAHAIQYVAPMPGYLGNGGPQVQRLEIVPGQDGLVLQFSHALYEGFMPENLYERDPIVLMENIPDGQFEFLTRDETGESVMWTTAWDDGSILPLAVHLDLSMPESSQVHWPILMASVRVDEAAVKGRNETRDYGEAIRAMIRKGGDSDNQ